MELQELSLERGVIFPLRGRTIADNSRCSGYNPNPNSSIPAEALKKEDESFQNFMKHYKAYPNENAASESESGNQDGVEEGEDDEDA